MEGLSLFLIDESGANLVEYALLLTFIALVTVTILNTLGANVQTTFTTASDGFAGAS